MVEATSMAERVTFFGDMTGIKPETICAFVKTTGHLYGGSYPNREENLPEEGIVSRTRELLAKAGVSNSSPITPCNSAEERARQILQNCSLRRRQHGEGLYWIIDRDPDSLAQAVKLVVTNGDPIQKEILKSITVIKLGPGQGSNYADKETGLSVAYLPHPLNPFPIHPTPDS